MPAKEQIVEVLLSNFKGVHCNTCVSSELNSVYPEKKDRCDCCHRKSMNWEISESFAESLANKILDKILGLKEGGSHAS